jgi:hypothetical protein
MEETKIPQPDLAILKTLGEYVFQNPTPVDSALAGAQPQIWGLAARRSLPRLQDALRKVTEAAGPANFDRPAAFSEIVGGRFSIGSPTEELRVAVRGALDVAYSLASADLGTYELFQAIEEWLRLAPTRAELREEEDEEKSKDETFGVSQSLSVISRDVGKIRSTVAGHWPGSASGTTQGHRGGGTGGKGTGQAVAPSVVGPTVFVPTVNPFKADVHVTGGEGPPYTLEVPSPTSCQVKFTKTRDPRVFTMTAFAPETLLTAPDPSSQKASVPFTVLLTSGVGKQPASQVMAIDWSRWLPIAITQPQMTLEGAAPTIQRGATVQLYEVKFRVRNLPSKFRVAVQQSQASPAYSLDCGYLTVWADLAFLDKSGGSSFTVQLSDLTGKPLCSSEVDDVKSVDGTTFTLTGIAGPNKLHANDQFTVIGTGIAPDATATLTPT